MCLKNQKKGANFTGAVGIVNLYVVNWAACLI